MKISELIKRLEKAKGEHGDVDVVHACYGGDTDIEDMEYLEEQNRLFKEKRIMKYLKLY